MTTLRTITRNKYYFILAGLSFFAFSFTFKKRLDCSKIKNGTFYYYSKISRDKVNIVRTDGVQLETNTKTGQIFKNKIIWKSDCVFDMYLNALNDSKLDKMDSLLATVPASVEIVNVGSKYYVSKWNMKIVNKVLTGIDTIYFKSINSL